MLVSISINDFSSLFMVGNLKMIDKRFYFDYEPKRSARYEIITNNCCGYTFVMVNKCFGGELMVSLFETENDIVKILDEFCNRHNCSGMLFLEYTDEIDEGDNL